MQALEEGKSKEATIIISFSGTAGRKFRICGLQQEVKRGGRHENDAEQATSRQYSCDQVEPPHRRKKANLYGRNVRLVVVTTTSW